MKKEQIQELAQHFEDHAAHSDTGVEFWLARDLQHLLGYAEWRNFFKVVTKAMMACEVSGNIVIDHFVDVNKTITMPKGGEKKIEDIMLTRYACYLIAQNGDPRKEVIAFAQNYFALQTRRLELIEQRIYDAERLKAREKLSLSEKELSLVIFEQTGSDKNFALIRSKGDFALFGGNSTKAMKAKLGVSNHRALADFLPTITIKAKDFASEITIFNARDKKMNHKTKISKEHVKNNQEVRKLLLERGIVPEKLPPEEDIKKLQRRVQNNAKKLDRNSEKLN